MTAYNAKGANAITKYITVAAAPANEVNQNEPGLALTTTTFNNASQTYYIKLQ